MTPPLTELLAQLYQLTARGALLGLDRVREAAEKLGSPHRVGTYVHIAGTNGKGSTAAFVAQMAQRSGATVGLYTSPHLCRFAERISIQGQPIDDELLARCLHKALQVAETLTFFEVATLAAFLAFQEKGVTLCVLEVGLGGRLDATNIVEGQPVTAITRIAFDHMNLLGTSITAIARQKAGILRPNAPCIVGRLHPDARAAIDDMAEQLQAVVYEAHSEEEIKMITNYPPSLPGMFQQGNAMIAVAIGRHLGFSTQNIGEGLTSTQWPGRFEIVETPYGYVVIDSAHNPDGALALKNSLLGVGAAMSRKQIALIFGAMADKNWKAMLDRLAPVTGPRFYTEPHVMGRATAPPHDLNAYLSGTITATIEDAIRLARADVGPNGLIVVAGSIFLAAQARSFLLDLPMDPAVSC